MKNPIIRLVVLGSVLLLLRVPFASGETGSEGPLPCPDSVPGFNMHRVHAAGVPEGDRNESLEKTRMPNGSGEITGGVNASPAHITFGGAGATVAGGVNGSPIDLKMDPATGTITGGANGSKVELTVRSNADCTFLAGGANGSPVEIRIDWKKGVLSGHSNHSLVRVEFQGKQGAVVALEGYAGHAPVDLIYDPQSGKLTGGLGRAKTDLTFRKVTLDEFLDYFFVFLEP